MDQQKTHLQPSPAAVAAMRRANAKPSPAAVAAMQRVKQREAAHEAFCSAVEGDPVLDDASSKRTSPHGPIGPETARVVVVYPCVYRLL